MRVERPKTPEEAEEYKDLKEITAERLFIDKVARFEQEYVKAHKPFCTKCAMEEFRMQMENLYNQMKMKYKRDFTKKEKPFIEFANNFPLEKYGHEYFNLIGIERKNMRRREGGDVWFELVINKNYSCKPYGHGCTVSTPQSEMNEDELAEERKRKAEIKAKIASSDPSLPSADEGRLPVGQHGDKPVLNPQPAHQVPNPGGVPK